MIDKSILDKINSLNTAKGYWLYCLDNLNKELKNKNITIEQLLKEISTEDLKYIK